MSSIIVLEKHSISKHLMRYFLLNYCKKSYEYQDCTSELNPQKIFQLISASTFGLQKKVFPNADNCQVWEWSTGLFNYVPD